MNVSWATDFDDQPVFGFLRLGLIAFVHRDLRILADNDYAYTLR